MNARPPLKEQLSRLVQLQEIDLRIQALTKTKESLPVQVKTLDVTLNALRKIAEQKKSELEEIEKGARQITAAMELNQDRADRTNKKLEAVTNNKEYQAAQREIEQLTKLNESLSTQKNETTTKLEAAKNAYDSAQAELDKVQAERDAKSDVVNGQVSEIDGELSRYLSERAKHLDGIDKSTLSRYDRVRTARGGLGIVPAVGGRCKGCNMTVPPQIYNEVLKLREVVSCPSCHRIIFVPEAAPSPSVAGSQQVSDSGKS